MKRGRRSGRGWGLFGLLALVVNIAGAYLLGPRAAARIALAGSLNTLVDGFAERPAPHGLPIIDVNVDEDTLRALEANMPFSGGRYVNASLVAQGLRYDARLRYRGVVIASHWLGEKKSFRLKLPKHDPFPPYRSLNFINPKTPDLLRSVMASRIAALMDVDAPYDDFAFVRMNGVDRGVMEMIEQPDGAFEKVRHRSARQTPVFKGDLPPSTNQVPKGQQLWADPNAWRYASKADSGAAFQRLNKLIAWVNAPDSARSMDTLATLIDLPAYLRYCAAIALLGTCHIDNYHNQWLVQDARSGLFKPVFWDAYPLFDADSTAFRSPHDALAFRVLADPHARMERDRALYRAWRALRDSSVFDTLMDRAMDELLPALLADRHKTMSVDAAREHVYRASILHWWRAAQAFREAMRAHLEKLRRGFEVNEVHAVRTDDAWRIICMGAPALRVAWEGSTPCTASGSATCETGDGTALLMPEAEARGISAFGIYSLHPRYEPLPMDVTLGFPKGAPARLGFFNATTDEEITPR